MAVSTLSQQIADKIFQMITTDQIFHPGDKLPNENELSEQLGVSRATLREAIRILNSQGTLEVFRGKGTFVTADVQSFCDVGLNDLSRIRIRLKDMYETRLLIEPQLAAIACRRASDDEIENILKLGDGVCRAIKAGKNRTKADQAMHQAIVIAAHNEFMLHLLPVVNRAITETLQINVWQDELSRITLQDHALLLDFIRLRDSEGARYAMDIHIRRAISTLGLNANSEPIF